jgi:hypothetical protein
MLTLQLSDFTVQLKDGAIRNGGASNKHATVKLYDVESTEVREFGDERVKLAFEDEEGDLVEVALFPEQFEALLEDGTALREGSDLFE